jgi:muramidase (phage lysozyme)
MTPSPTLAAFLALIGYSEGADYTTIVSGVDGPHSFTDFSAHPFAPQFRRAPIEVVAPGTRFPDGLYSTASGRYQFIYPTWAWLAGKLALVDFSPPSQDAACLELLRQHGVTGMILAGNIQQAIETCGQSWGWASMPGSTAGQGGHTMGDLLAKWDELSAS